MIVMNSIMMVLLKHVTTKGIPNGIALVINSVNILHVFTWGIFMINEDESHENTFFVDP